MVLVAEGGVDEDDEGWGAGGAAFEDGRYFAHALGRGTVVASAS